MSRSIVWTGQTDPFYHPFHPVSFSLPIALLAGLYRYEGWSIRILPPFFVQGTAKKESILAVFGMKI